MSHVKQIAALLECAKALKAHDSWAGETHIQKSMYLVQELLGEPLGFRFVLYRHGPFSFDLRDELNEMEAGRVIRLEEQPYPYGPKIQEGPAAPAIRNAQLLSAQLKTKIDFIATELGNAKVSTLERIATAYFVTCEPGIAIDKRPERLRQLKPHIDQPDAEEAFRRLEEIRAHGLERGFIQRGLIS